jgi:hypothetical protein
MAARDPLQCAWRRRRATCAPSRCPSPAATGAALARAALLCGVVRLGALRRKNVMRGTLSEASTETDADRAAPCGGRGRPSAQDRSQAPVGCPAASTGWRPRRQRRLHLAQCDIWRQPHSHVWLPCAVVYVHRRCSPCLRHGSHRGTRVGTGPAVGIMSAYLGDAQRGTPGSCRRGDKAAAMASYTKQAKDESLRYLAMRARAIRIEECRFSCGRGAEPVRPAMECRKVAKATLDDTGRAAQDQRHLRLRLAHRAGGGRRRGDRQDSASGGPAAKGSHLHVQGHGRVR